MKLTSHLDTMMPTSYFSTAQEQADEVWRQRR